MRTLANHNALPSASAGEVPKESVIAPLAEAFKPIDDLAARRNSTRVTVALASMHQLALGKVVEAERRLKMFPSRDDLEVQAKALREAIYEPADKDQTECILSALMEAIPAAQAAATDTLIDAMVLAIMHADSDPDGDYTEYRGFSAAVLFFTMRRAIKRFRFAPAIPEIIEIACAERDRLVRALKATETIMTLRDDAEDIIAIEEAAAKSEFDLDWRDDHIPF